MKPGVTASPRAGRTRSALAAPRSPSAAIRPCAMATSRTAGGFPVPSKTEPPRMITSNIVRPGAGSGGPAGTRVSVAPALSLGRLGEELLLVGPVGPVLLVPLLEHVVVGEPVDRHVEHVQHARLALGHRPGDRVKAPGLVYVDWHL